MTTNVIPDSVRYRSIKVLAAMAAVYLVLRAAGFQRLFINDAEGVSALLQIIGTLYSVLYAFATYVVWGQFTSVETEIVREAGALKDVILFSRRLSEPAHEAVVRAVKIYAREVVDGEWRALASNEETEKTDRLFSQVIASVTEVKPQDDSQRMVCEELLQLMSQASAHRDERLAVSAKRMPRTLLLLVTLAAITILFLLLFYPFRSAGFGLVSIGITTLLLFFAYFVLTDLDNPFEGTWNVGPRPFGELLAKYR